VLAATKGMYSTKSCIMNHLAYSREVNRNSVYRGGKTGMFTISNDSENKKLRVSIKCSPEMTIP
jgi:hypothetical protein